MSDKLSVLEYCLTERGYYTRFNAWSRGEAAVNSQFWLEIERFFRDNFYSQDLPTSYYLLTPSIPPGA